MFGSNFSAQFGLVGPPWDNLDAYGGIFGPNAPVTPLPGSVGLGETVTSAAQPPPVAGTPGIQGQPWPPQAPPVVSGNFTPETFYSQYQPDPADAAKGSAQVLGQGALAAGANSEFAKAR